MDDIEINNINEEIKAKEPVQLPQNFLLIGELEEDDIKVYIKQSVYKEIEDYAVSDTANESGTIILGNYVEENGKMHVVISGYIIAKYTDASASTLTFTHETWEYVYKEHDKNFPELKIIGWQHTHPGYGIFLSNYDMFIQENFFNLPFQVAYVIDPIQHIRGFFQWKNGKVNKLMGFYIYDDVGKSIKIEPSKVINNEPSQESVALNNKLGRIQSILLGALGIIIIGLVVFMVSFTRKYSRQSDKQESLENQIISQNILIARQAEEINSIKTSLIQMETKESDTQTEQKQEDKTEGYDDILQEGSGEAAWEDGEVKAFNTKEVYFHPYIVQPGDSLSDICVRFNINFTSIYKVILSINGIEDPDAIYVGQTILLPVEK